MSSAHGNSAIPVDVAGQASSSSYGQILKSTAFTGGASVINVALGIIRTKGMAVMLGPAGVGLAGILTTVATFMTTLALVGLNNSGVRQIAHARASGEASSISRVVKSLTVTSTILGLIGAVALFVGSVYISKITFGDQSHSSSVAALGLIVFVTVLSSSQTAIVQGMRQIGDLARINVLGGVFATGIGLPIIWLFRENGIIALLLLVPANALYFSWRASRKLNLPAVEMTRREIYQESRHLLNLGFSFMASAVATAAVGYLTRLLIVRDLGLAAAGHFTAAYTLSGIYAGFVLQAMGADFFPRLTSAAEDNKKMMRLVNEQAEIALLVALPGIVATLSFAPWVIKVFYAHDFEPAVLLLQWQVLGVFGRIVSWPLGFVILAKGRGALYIVTELLTNCIYVAILLFAVRRFGLTGAGIAFALLYLWYVTLMVFVTRAIIKFRWSSINFQILVCSVPIVGFVFVLATTMKSSSALVINTAITLAVSSFCALCLLKRVPQERLPLSLRKRLSNP